MALVFIKIPKTGSTTFEKNFSGNSTVLESVETPIYSVGHSWSYPTEIKGWRDWDFPKQSKGLYRPISTFNLNKSDRVVTIVRNPFDLLYSYFNYDWSECRKYHNLPTDTYTKEDFQKFVDIYLDDNIRFHAPAFKKSLFSQLKDKEGNWIINDNSIVLRFETLTTELEYFSNLTKIPLKKFSNEEVRILGNKPYNWWEVYTEEQIDRLSKLWQDDLSYFGYSSDDYKDKISVNKTKPKIALCFSGLIRDIDYTKKDWLNLIDKYDIDLYGSFWDVENSEFGDTIDNLKNTYKFKEVEFEPYSNFKKSTLDIITPYIKPPSSLMPHLIDHAKNLNLLSMWYKIWRANMMVSGNDENYDIVIRARTDTKFEAELDIQCNEYLNIPSGVVKVPEFDSSHGIADLFAYGNPKLMNYYSSLYLNILQYLHQGHYMIPAESLLKVHISRVDIDISFFTNKLIITRKYKDMCDEVYDKESDVKPKIINSSSLNAKVNHNIKWLGDIKKDLKF